MRSSFKSTAAAVAGILLATSVAMLVPAPAQAQTASNCTSTGDPEANFARTRSDSCTIASAGPLTHILVSPDANCQVFHQADEDGAQGLDGGECGTFVAARPSGSAEEPTLYGPNTVPCWYVDLVPDGCASRAGAPDAAFQVIDQRGVSGSGTPGDPYAIVTEYQAGTLHVLQTDSYVVGTESYRTDVQVTNTALEAFDTVLTRAANCWLQDSDSGTGRYTPETGAVACVPQTGPRVLAWQPISPGSHWFQGDRAAMWGLVAGKGGFPDQCIPASSSLGGAVIDVIYASDPCQQPSENAAGINWNFTVAAGETTTRSHWTTFSPYGQSSATIGDARVAEPVSGTVDAIFAVNLASPPAQTVRLDYATADSSAAAPGDYEAASGQVVFEPGETSKTVAVRVTADPVAESTENFHVVLSNPQDPLLPDPYVDSTNPLNSGLPSPPKVILTKDTGVGTIDDSRPGRRRWPHLRV